MARPSKIRVRHRLLTRLLLSHILIVSLPLFFTGQILVSTARKSIEETILNRNLEFTSRSTRLIELKLKTAKDFIKSQARNPSIYEMNRSRQQLTLNTLVEDFDLFKELSVLDSLGRVLATTSFEGRVSEQESSNGQQTKLLARLMRGESYQSDVYVSKENLPMLDMAEPILQHNEVVGILYAVVDLKAMWDIVRENVVGKKGEAFIFNSRGVYVAHSDARKVYAKSKFQNQAILAKIKNGESGQIIYLTPSHEQMLAAYAPIGDYGWGAMIQQPTSEAFAPAERMQVRVLQIMVISVLLASVLAFVYTRWIVKPVNYLVSGMERFSRGELKHRVEKVGDDEIGMLAEHFNDMADRLIEFQNTLKRTERLETLSKLASVLSHEIRNPLNSMVINMQILKRELSQKNLNRNRVDRFYDVLAAEIKRVDQLVTDFLMIARPPTLQKKKTPINELIDDVVMTQVASSLNRGIRVERSYETHRLEVEIDPA
ncbi:MAG: HAMP domain-containing protein, partial [Calditrichaeota bacterium]